MTPPRGPKVGDRHENRDVTKSRIEIRESPSAPQGPGLSLHVVQSGTIQNNVKILNQGVPNVNVRAENRFSRLICSVDF